MQLTCEDMPATNRTFSIAGQTCFYNNFMVKQTSVFQISICGEVPRHFKNVIFIVSNGFSNHFEYGDYRQ